MSKDRVFLQTIPMLRGDKRVAVRVSIFVEQAKLSSIINKALDHSGKTAVAGGSVVFFVEEQP